MDAPTPKTPTPLLDLEEVLPAKRPNTGHEVGGLRTVFVLLGLGMFAIGINIAMANYGLLAFCYFFLGLVVGVIIHELAHLLAGRFVGVSFGGISIGPIALYDEYGRIVLRRSTTSNIGGAFYFSISKLCRVRRKTMWVTAAGPLSNFVTGGLLLAARSLSQSASPAMTVIGATWVYLALSNLAFSSGPIPSDGEQLLGFLSRDKARRWVAILGLEMLRNRGVRARELPWRWIKAAIGKDECSLLSLHAHLFAYTHENDLKKRDTAAMHLERCLQLIGSAHPALSELLTLEASVFTAWFREDAETAEAWRKKVTSKRRLPKLMLLRADIALACAHRRFAEALTLCDEGLKLITALPRSTRNASLGTGWREWKDEIEEKRDRTVNVIAQ